MNDLLDILMNGGTDDPQQLLRAARQALVAGIMNGEAREIIDQAMEEFGPETVYMDGELFAGGW